MASINLRQFATIAELRQLAQEIEQEIQRRWEEERERFRTQAHEVAAQYGMQLEALLQPPKRPKKKGKAVAAPKYYNPADPSEVWNGHGKMPEWFAKALRAGISRHAMEKPTVTKSQQEAPGSGPEEDESGA